MSALEIGNIHDKFVEIVGSGLHYYENVDKINTATCTASEIHDLCDGWEVRYRSDVIFNNKVQSIVARLIQVINV